MAEQENEKPDGYDRVEKVAELKRGLKGPVRVIEQYEAAKTEEEKEKYEDAINKCSTDYAPWYVVPSNKKWYRNLVIARAITDTLEAMNPQYPQPEEGLDKIVIPD